MPSTTLTHDSHGMQSLMQKRKEPSPARIPITIHPTTSL
jgi:hypothetical protein